MPEMPAERIASIDQIAPCFIFAIGLTYGASLARRLARGNAVISL
jgi:hypothetical protein